MPKPMTIVEYGETCYIVSIIHHDKSEHDVGAWITVAIAASYDVALQIANMRIEEINPKIDSKQTHWDYTKSHWEYWMSEAIPGHIDGTCFRMGIEERRIVLGVKVSENAGTIKEMNATT